MSRALIETTNLVVNLTPKPIDPSWIIEGNPVAQWCVLSKSADRHQFRNGGVVALSKQNLPSNEGADCH
jgi:hypothetical protein